MKNGLFGGSGVGAGILGHRTRTLAIDVRPEIFTPLTLALSPLRGEGRRAGAGRCLFRLLTLAQLLACARSFGPQRAFAFGKSLSLLPQHLKSSIVDAREEILETHVA